MDHWWSVFFCNVPLLAFRCLILRAISIASLGRWADLFSVKKWLRWYLSGSVVLGSVSRSVGAGAAMSGCTVALGAASSGPDALACAVIGGGMGGWFGGEIGEKVGESDGKVTYELLIQ